MQTDDPDTEPDDSSAEAPPEGFEDLVRTKASELSNRGKAAKNKLAVSVSIIIYPEVCLLA